MPLDWLVPWFMVGKPAVLYYVELQTLPLINENPLHKCTLLCPVMTWSKRVHFLDTIRMPSDFSLHHIEYIISVGHPLGNI